MARKPTSPADEVLLAAARARSSTVTATQLERWRGAGLLPRNVTRSLGRGRGSTSAPADGVVDLVVWLAQHARPGRRPHDLALHAFGEGLAVPEPTVRAAWRASVQRVVLSGERDLPAPADGEDRTDWAWDVAERAAANAASVVLPRRMRRIDERLAAAGVSWAPSELTQYDRGPAGEEPVTARDFATFAAAGVLAGAPELTGPAMAPHVRALLPVGAVSPVASWLEYPDEPGRDPAEINDGAGLSLLPIGDVREDLLRVIDEAEPHQLRAAWRAAAEMREWALEHCGAVEAELDAGELGDATLAWMMGAILGLPRLLVRQALLDRRPSISTQVSTAVMVLWIGVSLHRLRRLMPDGQYELLPALLPPFLHPLAGIPLKPVGEAAADDAVG
ncbi:hypothetical protein [Micromonospora sp. NPDC050200]|uniref:hypothetical protein n=1 Tax=Micromonospora sp. NPDC050200 TaxID=3155664 RepID=UPI0033FD1E4D